MCRVVRLQKTTTPASGDCSSVPSCVLSRRMTACDFARQQSDCWTLLPLASGGRLSA